MNQNDEAGPTASPPEAEQHRPSTAEQQFTVAVCAHVSAEECAVLSASKTVLGSTLADNIQVSDSKIHHLLPADAYSFDSFQSLFRPLLNKLHGCDLYLSCGATRACPQISTATWSAHAKSLRLVAFRNLKVLCE